MTNAELDEAIFAIVKSGKKSFAVIIGSIEGVDYRSADRALQRLRKAGRVEYKNGWRIVLAASLGSKL